MIATAAGSVCAVCRTPSEAPIYRHDGPISVSSTGRPIAIPTAVYVCTVCGHVQTPPLDDITGYYENAYNVHLESANADDLYEVRAGVPIYRAQHQATVALQKLALPSGASVLDYGCGKGMSLHALLTERPDIDGAVFDVSDVYRDAWDAFVPREKQAAFSTPGSWQGRFDAVLSFFALEHVADARGFLRDVGALLRPGGQLHVTVPNVRRNIGDFIVVDHVNHFMPTSLRRVFVEAGFTEIRIDEEAHDAAYVVTARRGGENGGANPEKGDAVRQFVEEAHEFASFWSRAGNAVAAFERDRAKGRRSAIYGSGFYGVFIASRLADRTSLAYFLDRNPYQQAKRIFDRAILPPDAIGDDIDVVYVGLNPVRAREIVAGVAPLRRRAREYFYL